MYNHILSIILFTPLVGAVVLMLIPGEHKNLIRWVANIFALLGFAVSLPLVSWFWQVKDLPGFKFVEGAPNTWIPTIGAGYYLGIDGISFLLIMLTTFLGAICSPLLPGRRFEDRVKEYYAWFLVLQTGMLGVFMSLDFFLFFVFWEAMLVPMYLLIGIWGGPRRLYAAIKFFLYTLFGSVLMLLSVLFLYIFHHAQTGVYTFSIQELYHTAPLVPQVYGTTVAITAVLRILPGLRHQGSDVPLPHLVAGCARRSAHRRIGHPRRRSAEDGNLRPDPLLAAVLPCRGALPQSAPPMITLSIIGIIYGGLVSLVQKDMKKLVAYSSVSHLGFCTLGIFALNGPGLAGSVLQQINHGISTGALFLIVGILYERRHTRDIAEYGGISTIMPVYATIALIMFLSSMGLPLLNGFVGEFTILQAAFMANHYWAAWAVPGVVLAAAYLLWLYQRVFFGKVENPKNEKLLDLSARELATFLPLVAVALWIGLYPKPFFQILDQPVTALVEQINHPQVYNARQLPVPVANAQAAATQQTAKLVPAAAAPKAGR